MAVIQTSKSSRCWTLCNHSQDVGGRSCLPTSAARWEKIVVPLPWLAVHFQGKIWMVISHALIGSRCDVVGKFKNSVASKLGRNVDCRLLVVRISPKPRPQLLHEFMMLECCDAPPEYLRVLHQYHQDIEDYIGNVCLGRLTWENINLILPYQHTRIHKQLDCVGIGFA